MEKDLLVTIPLETDKAIFCIKERKGKKVEFWLPKSQIYIYKGTETNKMTGETRHRIRIPEWLYDKTFGSWNTKKLQNKPKARTFKEINTNIDE